MLEIGQNAINTEVQKEEKQNKKRRRKRKEEKKKRGSKTTTTFEIRKDIYNTFAILKATMVSTKQGPQSIWQARFSFCEKGIFCFLLFLIIVIQCGGFTLLWYGASIASQGTQVYLDSGVVNYTLPNVTYNYTMDISYADLTLLDIDPTEPDWPDHVDVSALMFSQLVADACIVLYIFKGLHVNAQLPYLSVHLPSYRKQKCLLLTLSITKIMVLIWGAFASLRIIGVARTSIEAFEKAFAVFFLVETSEWVYGVIRFHPEISDELYQIKDDYERDDYERDDYDDAENKLKRNEYQIYKELTAKNAFVEHFMIAVIFYIMFVSVQFVDQFEFFPLYAMFVALFLILIWLVRRIRVGKEAKRLAKQQASVNDNDYQLITIVS